MTNIVSQTGPNDEGELLWCVHFQSSRFDHDPHMPGDLPIDIRSYVLAKNKNEAIAKAQPDIEDGLRRSDKSGEEIQVSVVTLEDLIPARDSSQDGRLGFTSNKPLRAVELSSPEDKKRYRLAVCLVPVK